MSITTAAAALAISTAQQAKNNDTKATETITSYLNGAINTSAQKGNQLVQFDTRALAKNLVQRYGFGGDDVAQGVTTAVVIIVPDTDISLSFYDLAPAEIGDITTQLNTAGYSTTYDPDTFTYIFTW